ncbi:MAG: protein-L-isoaspartate O-methyltransferase [Patescibacteria group bacterium]
MFNNFSTNQELVGHLKSIGVLKTPLIISAFEKIDRKDFVPKQFENEAYGDYPLSIGQGQTISQPYTVAFMLELLQPQPGEKILDIGAGSGWTTALLAYIISQQGSTNYQLLRRGRIRAWRTISKEIPISNNQNELGKVYAIEVIPELCEFGAQNCNKYKFVSDGVAKFFCQDGNLGLKDYAPFDKILASAALSKKELPQAWKDQLKVRGRIVCPIMNSIFVFDKIKQDKWQEEEHYGFNFVPLVKR